MGGLAPLKIPASFWQRDDVGLALDQRDIGALFQLLRQHAGASQQRIGTAVDMQQGSVSVIMSGSRDITSIDVLHRIADGLAMPDDARIRLGLAPRDSGLRRRAALGIGLVAALTPATLTTVLRESTAEAVEYTRQRGTTAVGAGTMDNLTSVIAGLDRAYPWQAATDLFPVTRAYRQYVEKLLNGRHTLAEARELHVHAAYLSHLCSDLAVDLGSTVAARAYGNDAYQLAEYAGHDELCAWAADTLAMVVLLDNRPREAAAVALRGLSRVPRRHPLAARLHSVLAQCRAREGNRAATAAALTKARKVCDGLPDSMPSRHATDSADHLARSITTHAATCHIELAEWKQAEIQARAALDVAKWSPGRGAASHLDLAVALANLGFPDAAGEHCAAGIALRNDHGGTAAVSLRQRVVRLDTVLATRYPDVPATKDFRERYRHLITHAAAP